MCSINLVFPDPVGPFNINGILFSHEASKTLDSLSTSIYFGSFSIINPELSDINYIFEI